MAVREQIERLVEEGTDPSLAVAVARDGKVIWEEGFGLADRAQNIAATENTVYNLGSVSKPLTATGLMVLVEQGLIDLDRPVNDYLGDSAIHACVGDASEATVRKLSDHTAGLPGHFQIFYEDQLLRPLPLEATILRYGNLVSPSGEKWQFSNLGYGVLGAVISEVSGKSYVDFMEEEVFVPLGMANTSLGFDATLGEQQAIQYTPNGRTLPRWTYDTPAALAISSSAHDLLRFAMFHLKNDLPDQEAILSDAAIDEMHRPTAALSTGGYGIGWSVTEKNGLTQLSHGSVTAGASAQLVLVPAENLAVAVLSNTSSNSPELIAQEILAALLPDEFVEETPGEGEDEMQPSSPDPALAGVWQGLVFTYMGDVPIALEIAQEGEPILVSLGLPGDQSVLLEDVSYGDDSTLFQSSGGGPYLRGCFPGVIHTEEMVWLPPRGLCLELKLREETLSGVLMAISGSEESGGYLLSHCVELWRN